VVGSKWVASVGAKCWILKCEKDDEYYQGNHKTNVVDYTAKCEPCQAVTFGLVTTDETEISYKEISRTRS
jgi:hypothetical protein